MHYKFSQITFIIHKVRFFRLNQFFEVTLREGYTVKFFFQSASCNTNLTLTSKCILALNLNKLLF